MSQSSYSPKPYLKDRYSRSLNTISLMLDTVQCEEWALASTALDKHLKEARANGYQVSPSWAKALQDVSPKDVEAPIPEQSLDYLCFITALLFPEWKEDGTPVFAAEEKEIMVVRAIDAANKFYNDNHETMTDIINHNVPDEHPESELIDKYSGALQILRSLDRYAYDESAHVLASVAKAYAEAMREADPELLTKLTIERAPRQTLTDITSPTRSAMLHETLYYAEDRVKNGHKLPNLEKGGNDLVKALIPLSPTRVRLKKVIQHNNLLSKQPR